MNWSNRKKMKKILSFLPLQKQKELEQITTVIKGLTEPEQIILFGSYARGSWVEDTVQEGHITYEYMSDFDILVIVKGTWLANNVSLWHKINKKIQQTPSIKTWVNIIVHDAQFVNKKLTKGEYFFADIKNEGVLLYDSKKIKLSRIKKLNPKQRMDIAQEDFRLWFGNAKEFYKQFEAAFKRKSYRVAAFELHQATERFYMAILLVFTHYKPKIHDLEKLGQMVAAQDPIFLKVFNRSTDKEKNLFDLLQKAYIDARYKKTYRIKKGELEYLAARVKMLQQLAKTTCQKKIESFD